MLKSDFYILMAANSALGSYIVPTSLGYVLTGFAIFYIVLTLIERKNGN